MAKINSIGNASGSLTIDPGSSGDSFIQFDINATGKFRVGVDDDDSDKFKISSGSALGTNDCFVLTSAGEITQGLQSAFLAIDGTAANQTGDGTAYTVVYATEVFDQNGDFDGTSTFTAPVTGKYQFNISIQIEGITGSHTRGKVDFVTSNRTYYGGYVSPAAAQDSSNEYSFELSYLVDMDASDTAYVSVTVYNGTLVVDIGADTYFSGYLAC